MFLSDFLYTISANETVWRAIHILLKLWPVWGLVLAVYLAFRYWFIYKQQEWIRAQDSLLLEIRLPNEILKSPALMEVVIQSMHQSGVGSFTDVYLKGRVRAWFSLELVSEGGKVHFYVWMHKKWKGTLENALYAQFPQIEVHEVPDYALPFRYDPAKYKYGKFSHLVLTKPDAYPIKTYIDYGLDRDPKEEYKNDPIAPVLEFLGSLKPGEHAWIQIMIRAHAKEGLKYNRFFVKPDWKKAVDAEIKKIAKEAKFKTPEDKGGDSKFLSEGQKETIAAIERTVEKAAFDTMIRVAYFAEEAVFNANNIGGILGVLKQFSSQTLNGFKPSWYDFDYPWQDVFGKKDKTNREGLAAYQRRSFFHEPYKNLHDDKSFILTTEELATLYHFPSSMVAATPTLARIPSKKAEAPANLPV